MLFPPFVVELEAADTRMFAAETVVAVLTECHVRRIDTQKPDRIDIPACRARVLFNHSEPPCRLCSR